MHVQQSIWNEISKKQSTFKIQSKTASIQDSFRGVEEEIKRYIDGVDVEDGQTGFFVSTNRGFLAMDSFSSRELFLRVWKKLLLSYALDAYEDMLVGGEKRVESSPEKLLPKLEELKTKEGENILFLKSFVIKVFVRKGKKLHISVFPKGVYKWEKKN